MPKMTRALFAGEVERVWELARGNFVRDKRLTGAIIGYDAMFRQTTFLAVGEEQYDNPEERALVTRGGLVPIRGDFRDNAEVLQGVFRENKIVAAIRISEAWLAKAEIAHDVARYDMRPGEHPMSDEVILVNGVWPREHFSVLYQSVITRDDRGENPTLGPRRETDLSNMHVEAWLADILPQPY